MTQILVVDDEKKMGILIEGTLKDAGYSVKTVTSGDKALELLKKLIYDIVITDLKMEPVDGMQVLKKAKELKPTLREKREEANEEILAALTLEEKVLLKRLLRDVKE